MAIGSVYRPFVAVAREAGVDVDAVLRRMGLDEPRLMQTRLSPQQGRTFVTRLRRLTGDEEIGLHAAQRAQLKDLDVIGYMARHAGCALEALEAVVRYPRLLGDTADVRLTRSGEHVTIACGRTGDQRFLPEGADFMIASLFLNVQSLSDGHARCVEVWLPRRKPRRLASYQALFGVTPRFGAERGALRFVEATLRRPIPESDGRLMGILEEHAALAHAALPSDEAWLERVRDQLGRALARGQFDIGAIAARCGVSDRTLRRRLQDAGTSFRDLSDEVRRVRALELIDEGHQQVNHLAEAVGYRDPAAFSRAFRRWTGLAPARYLADRR
ncbi:MAG: AraC family transcriptional regulator ligand-binding domain-containing protein [Polyangiales bacterium]